MPKNLSSLCSKKQQKSQKTSRSFLYPSRQLMVDLSFGRIVVFEKSLERPLFVSSHKERAKNPCLEARRPKNLASLPW